MDKQFYIGFGSLENFFDAISANIDLGQKVFISNYVKQRTDEMNFQHKSSFLMVARVLDGECYYWQIPIGTVNWITEAHGFNSAVADKRAVSLKQVIKGYIQSEFPHIRIIEAMVAMPKDLILMEGDFDILQLNKVTDEYYLKEAKTDDTKET